VDGAVLAKGLAALEAATANVKRRDAYVAG
jgi:hypothetical protein